MDEPGERPCSTQQQDGGFTGLRQRHRQRSGLQDNSQTVHPENGTSTVVAGCDIQNIEFGLDMD